jgi:hypothetical protein
MILTLPACGCHRIGTVPASLTVVSFKTYCYTIVPWQPAGTPPMLAQHITNVRKENDAFHPHTLFLHVPPSGMSRGEAGSDIPSA